MKFDFSDLVDQKLVVLRPSANYPNLSVAKYSKKVFYKNLWNADSRLLDARGAVLDDKNNVVIWPFTKVFNRHENNTDLHCDTPVIAVRKVNGFMAAARMFKGNLIVSTTGSLDSDFAVLARTYIKNHKIDPGYTYLFEICAPEDPHIVAEEFGAYLIGRRCMRSGTMQTEEMLDSVASDASFKRPEWYRCTMGQIVKDVAHVRHEGFMIRLDTAEQNTVMKIKSVHYLTKKFLMRMSKNNIERMFNNVNEFRKNVDEEFYDIVDYIVNTHTAEDWAMLDQHDRRSIIETFFTNGLT